jgi:parvulin-like peptidyl-prolyl isomerase
MKQPLIFLFLTVLIGLFFTACSEKDDNNRDVVAQVNTATIKNTELEEAIPRDVSDEVRLALKRDFMEKWIEDEIFYQTAIKEGLNLNEKEKLQISNYERSLLIKKFLDSHLSNNFRILDQEVEDYYNTHKREFTWDDDYIHIIHLVMENDDAVIKTEIRGSKDLMEVIRKNSLDQQSTPERPIGDIGYQKLNEFPEEIVKHIKNMRTGNISGPLKTRYGYHYIQLIDMQRKGETKELDLVRGEIVMRLQVSKRNEEMENLKQELRSRFTIQTDLSKVAEP